ncbi:MAG TPA: iron chelate uptake ABC transporter family permease subunit [Flavilitoribacter sp.]|nr:iron chelate uptake ABC transporter family permease subunit [Flavilitoribacter sp.]
MMALLKKYLFSVPALGIALLICTAGALFFGAFGTGIREIGQAFYALGYSEEPDLSSYLILHIRLPRILLAGLTGAGLAVAGAAIQGLFRNPMADPSLIGVTGGAMLFAVGSIVLMGALSSHLTGFLQQASIAVFAFAGGLATTYAVYFLSRYQGRTQVMTMLLAGIAITALTGAVAGFFIYISNEQQLRDITFWSLGSFSGSDWPGFLIAGPVIIAGFVVLIKAARPLNALLLGEKEAVSMGFRVERIKTRIILVTALIVGVCISISGIIGFVGLVIPHFLRLIRGTDYRYLMKASALLGAVFLILTDTLARTIIAPAELPIGILTAIVGAPFFLWLLIRSRQDRLTL